MKKRILRAALVLLLSIPCVLSASAGDRLTAGNSQKIYAVDDPIHTYISNLYVLEGRSLPSTAGPWSGAELDAMLSVFDGDALTGMSSELYERASAILGRESSASVIRVGVKANEEMYIHTASSDPFFLGRDNWVRGWGEQDQFLRLWTDNRVGSILYGYFEFSWGVSKDWRDGNDTSRIFGDSVLWTNTPFLMQNNLAQFNMDFPYRAFISAGGEHWSLQVGRDRLTWGNGKTGNFVIDRHLKRHDMLRFSAFDGPFKFTYVISSFPHPKNYYIVNDDGTMTYSRLGLMREDGSYYGQSQVLSGIAAFVGHRMEWRIIPSLTVCLSEGIMYYSADSTINFSAFLPLFMYHNLYERSNSNSIFSIDADWTFARGWNLYGQFVLDDLYLSGESEDGTDLIEPNSLGFLAGITYMTPLAGGLLSVNLEGALTQPYLYLRDGDAQTGETSREQTYGRYGLSYVVALREMSGSSNTQNYNLEFLGYPYGGDAIVGNLNVEYRRTGKWSVGSNIFFMVHGTHDRYTVWSRVEKGTSQLPPTTTHRTANYNDDKADERDAASKTLVTGICGSMELGSGFSAGIQADYINIWNVGNRTANGHVSDLQLTVMLSYSI